MLTLEEIKKRLMPMNLQYVARETGVHANVLYKIQRGHQNPKYETVKRLSDWMEGQR